MDIRDRRGLKLEARQALGAAGYDPKKLILMHTGASMALSLVLSLVSHLLDQQIGGTGGLSGVGLRSALETVQMVLLIGQMSAVLFWQIGYTYVSLRISRRESVGPAGLAEGFRQFGPVLRLRLITMAIYGGILFAASYLATMILSFTPLANPLLEAYEIGTEEAMLEAMDAVMLPLAVIALAITAVLALPVYYRLRMADLALMEEPRAGAMAAIRKSRVMTYGRRMELFKLDLSFWWFYGLEMVTMVVAYGDLILPVFGLQLPWSDTVSYYVFLVLSCLGQLALYWWRGNEVQVTYARAYEALLPREE